MEKTLDKCLSDATSVSGVLGAICADSQGLCLQSRGKIPDHSAGLVSFLAETAANLEPHSHDEPIIILESDTTNIYIKKVNNVTTAIYKVTDHNT